ncbi:GreA/GreB family elongation factor [Lactiplantibacillus pentosus]|uniref:GreA/GreB family elongation factor n=1 Tax=Lactiplantibacillus pentosus TaxID=1589 RepID=UPI00207AFBAB|nr:GreA/GreB family elongation factor [Lactiplantibacillus pentosus]
MICKKASQTGKMTTPEKLDDHGRIAYQLVGKREANLEQPKISFTSPIGQALANHTVGDVFTVSAPNWDYQVKMIAVKRA